MNLRETPREFKELPLGLIDAPALASRTSMDDERMDELVASVRQIGLQQPIIVARQGDRFEVIAGHRRRIACGRAGLAAAPCIIYPSKDVAQEAIKYAENRFREELNAAEEAIWFSELLERDHGGDTDRLAAALGERRDYVENRLLLFSGDPSVFEQLQKGEIQIGVAHQLNRCTDQTYRRYLLHQAIQGGATVAVVRGWLLDWQRQQPLASGAPAPAPAASSPGPVPQSDYFTCAVCHGTHDVHRMRPLNVHDYCQLAVLDKLLATYHGEA